MTRPPPEDKPGGAVCHEPSPLINLVAELRKTFDLPEDLLAYTRDAFTPSLYSACSSAGG